MSVVPAGASGLSHGRQRLTHTFRSPCSYCPTVVREEVEYCGHYAAEGRATFTGGVECHACFLIVCSDCLPGLGRCRVRDDCPIRRPV